MRKIDIKKTLIYWPSQKVLFLVFLLVCFALVLTLRSRESNAKYQ